jgi:TonB family protein
MKHLLRITLLAAALAITSARGDEKPEALALPAPRPVKLPEASRLHLAGSGVFVIQVNRASGKVTSIELEKSTGHKLLDSSAIHAFQQWRCKPGQFRGSKCLSHLLLLKIARY